jgi:hypothetical protein
MTMLYARYAFMLRDERLKARVERHLRALAVACLPHGEALYFGRSENTIFGYACAIDAFSRFEILCREPPAWVLQTKRQLVRYLLSTFDPERVHCQPMDFEEAGVPRSDSYIHDSVYTAYTAMLLLDLPLISVGSVKGGEQKDSPNPKQKNWHNDVGGLPQAGLLTAAGDRTALGLATNGQARFRDSGVPDARYAGLVPHAFASDGRAVLPGVPIAYREVGMVPFLPMVRYKGRWFAPLTWQTQTPTAEDPALVEVHGRGEWYPAPTPMPGRVTKKKDVIKGGATVPAADSKGDRRPLSQEIKHIMQRDERVRRVAAHGHRIAKRGMQMIWLDYLYERVAKRVVDLPVTAHRKVEYRRREDVLAVETIIEMGNRQVAVRPSSYIVADEFMGSVYYECSPSIKGRAFEVIGHRGEGRWYIPNACEHSRVKSSISFDPTNRL